MRVKRDFEAVYRAESDPWKIGEADSDRYNLYFDLIEKHAGRRGSVLDIGCGFGAFLARFEREFATLTGVELSAEAIRKGQGRFPFIRFLQGSAEALDGVAGLEGPFDAVIYSDVICYFGETGRRRSLAWIAAHLSEGGLAFIAAWCPGGKYLTPGELERLVRRYFKVEERRVLDSGHAVFAARRRRTMAAATVDCETWHPVPPGCRIDWEEDVFRPAEAFMAMAEGVGVPLTFMAEMGEYFWLKANEPALAARMEVLWAGMARRGHDVQLHLHPSWLPEMGARREGERWHWDGTLSRPADYPGDLAALIKRCREALEAAVRPGKPDHRVTVFRAGAYQVQPFRRLHQALAAAGIAADSSVWAGGVSAERGYDFTLAWSDHQPWLASAWDPQLPAPPAERGVVELPVFTWAPGRRWFLDGTEGRDIARNLLDWLRRRDAAFFSSEAWRRRQALRTRLGDVYARLKGVRGLVNRLLPRGLAHGLVGYPPPDVPGHDYFVLIGHTKGEHDLAAVGRNLAGLKRAGVEFVTLSAMAAEARAELEETARENAGAEAAYQVAREYPVVMGRERNEAQSALLQGMMPLDRDAVLDLGCGAGDWSARLHALYPWMRVTGLDRGLDFVARAGERRASPSVRFLAGDFLALPLAGGSFDAVYADNSLEHAWDVDATLAEIARVLRPGGALLAAVPPDALNPDRTCDNHVWKTAPHEIRMRLEAAGFTDIYMEEIDTFRRLGQPPYPPSGDLMVFLLAWKRPKPAGPEERAREIMGWVYRRLDPSESQASNDWREILAGGRAFCMGYAIVLGEILEREGFPVKWVTMVAAGHPRGKGKDCEDTHEVLSVAVDGREVTMDPMANAWFPSPPEALIADPRLAVPEAMPDDRWRARGYDLYAAPFWYERVRRWAVRDRLADPLRFREKR